MKILIIKNIQVINANAISSPFTIGFPAITAWLGAVHALQRILNDTGFEQVRFVSTGIVSHDADLQIYRGPGDYVSSIIGTANPLDKDGERPSFVEEGRIHIDISLAIEVNGLSKKEEAKGNFTEVLKKILLSRLKIAGGDILQCGDILLKSLDEDDPKSTKRFFGNLMPGYAIVERRDLMVDAMKEGKDALEAMIEYLAIHHRCEEGVWLSERKVEGWIVPVAIGYHGISELGTALNQRDPDTLHRFAESIVTLGEFKMPFRLGHISELLWRYSYDEENALYLCKQNTFI